MIIFKFQREDLVGLSHIEKANILAEFQSF